MTPPESVHNQAGNAELARARATFVFDGKRGMTRIDVEATARPLKRTIQKRIQDPLAMKILEGEFHDGDHIQVDAQDGEFAFTRALPAEVA